MSAKAASHRPRPTKPDLIGGDLKGEREGAAVALGANRLFGLNVAAPAGRGMTLASPGADRLNISEHLLRRDFNLAMAFVATCLFRMRPVLEII